MDEHTIPRIPSPIPSTPPFLNIASPDFRSFRAYIRSPTAEQQKEEQHSNELQSSNATSNEHLFGQLSELDFEAAYALLTKTPTTFEYVKTPPSISFTSSIPAVPPQPQQTLQYSPGTLPNINQSPIPNIQPPDLNDFKKMLFQSQTPSPKAISPMIDLETLAYFNNPSPSNQFGISDNYGSDNRHGDELLSANESNALEQFLDSIIDDKIKDERAIGPGPSIEITPYGKPSQLGFDPPPALAEGPPFSFSSVSAASNERPLSQRRDRAEEEAEADSDSKEPKKRQRKRRKLLSEEEKKHNHTTSEQRRRGMIKEAFDDLVKFLPKESLKVKNQSKSVILEKTVLEIQKLIRVNNELEKLLRASE